MRPCSGPGVRWAQARRLARADEPARREGLKGYSSWGRDYSPEYWPPECGLAKLLKPEKPFLNCGAWLAIAERPARDVISFLAIEAEDADATGGEPIFLPGGAVSVVILGRPHRAVILPAPAFDPEGRRLRA